MQRTEDRRQRLLPKYCCRGEMRGFDFRIFADWGFCRWPRNFSFVGVLQQSFAEMFKNEHGAVWIAAFLLALCTFNFTGFCRLVLGVLLGYLFLYGRNLWLPIASIFSIMRHLVGYFLFGETDFMQRIENQPLTLEFGCWAAISLIVTFFVSILQKRMEDV